MIARFARSRDPGSVVRDPGAKKGKGYRYKKITRRTRDRLTATSYPRVLTRTATVVAVIQHSAFSNSALSIRRATSRRGASSRREIPPSTMASQMTSATSSRIGASSRTSRSRASIRCWHFSSCRNPSILYRQCRPSAHGDAGGSQCLPCVRHRALPRSSTRARCLSGAPPFHLCSQSRAAWPDPLTRIRDLPWPRYASSRAGGSTLVSRTPR
jgi:hypothetical protein